MIYSRMRVYIRLCGLLPHNCFRCLQMKVRQPSKVFSLRVQADLVGEIDEVVRHSGKDKSAWILGMVLDKLGKPDPFHTILKFGYVS